MAILEQSSSASASITTLTESGVAGRDGGLIEVSGADAVVSFSGTNRPQVGAQFIIKNISSGAVRVSPLSDVIFDGLSSVDYVIATPLSGVVLVYRGHINGKARYSLLPFSAPSFSPSQFTIETLVFVGASITNDITQSSTHTDWLREIFSKVYGITINNIFEHAVDGRDVSEIDTDMSTILANYTGQSNVVFALHMGGNDIAYGSEFTDYSTAIQNQKIASYNSVLDKIEAAGHKAIPFGLTFRNTPDGVDNDPSAAKSNELGASWTYNRDWIQPIIAARYPHLITNGKLAASMYEYTRSVYDMFLSGSNPTSSYNGDLVHPNEWGDFAGGAWFATVIANLSLGQLPPTFDEVNFNTSFSSPATTIDIVVSPYDEFTTPDTNNINWFEVPYGNAVDNAPFDTNGYYTHKLENLINVDGSAASGVSVLIAGGTGMYPDNAVTGSDTSNSLTNTTLRKTVMYAPDLGLGILIDGLEPSRNYEASMVYRNGNGGDGDTTFYANDKDGVQRDPANELYVQSTRSDPLGRIICRVRGTTVGLSGLRIRSV